MPHVDLREIGGSSCCQTLRDPGERRRGRLPIDLVEGSQRVSDAVLAQALEQDNRVEVVPHGVPYRQEPRLDPSHLGKCRHAKSCDFLRLERACAAKLADPREDAIELSEDQHGPLDTLGLPPGCGLEQPSPVRHVLDRRHDARILPWGAVRYKSAAKVYVGNRAAGMGAGAKEPPTSRA